MTTNVLTLEDLEKHVASIEFSKLWKKTTVCLLTLDNGFEIVTSSSCIDPENYDQYTWEDICRQKAIDKLRELYGFMEHQK